MLARRSFAALIVSFAMTLGLPPYACADPTVGGEERGEVTGTLIISEITSMDSAAPTSTSSSTSLAAWPS